MKESNPDATPSANLAGDSNSVLTGQPEVARSTLEILRRSKGWARFVGVCLLILGGVIWIVALIGVASSPGEPVESTAFLTYRPQDGLVFGLAGLILFYPGVRLNGYHNAIGRLLAEPTVAKLDHALNQQRLLWRFFTIVVVLGVLALLATAVTMRILD